jgi:hypothetical protein
MVANSGIAVVGDVFGPAVAAITLGTTATFNLARALGIAFDHAGNVAIAATAGGNWMGYFTASRLPARTRICGPVIDRGALDPASAVDESIVPVRPVPTAGADHPSRRFKR